MNSDRVNRFFITGTDTGVGKTKITSMLINTIQNAGFTAIGCKPVACGVDELGKNEDVCIYQTINSLNLADELINPICLKTPVSPNIAASLVGQEISFEKLINSLQKVRACAVDYIFYEGVGGWLVPLSTSHTMADVVSVLALPVILVVGLRVGCLNHALLTWQSMQEANAAVVGWIANIIDPTTPAISGHIETLQKRIAAPYLGCVPYVDQTSNIEQFIDMDLLLADYVS